MQENSLEIEYLPRNEQLAKEIKDSPFRFDVALLEVPDLKKIKPTDIEELIKEYYQDIEIVYITFSKNHFFIKPLQYLPGFQEVKTMECSEIYNLVSFLCRQVQSRREQKMLEGLHNLTLEINEKNVDLTDNLELTCRTAVEIMKVDHSGFVLFEKNLSKGKVAAEFPKIMKDETIEIPVKGIEWTENLVFKKEYINIQNLLNESTKNGKLISILTRLQIRSILMVPVVLNQKVIASFSLDMIKKCRHFYKDEIEFCKKLAAHVALAVGNARNLKEISVINEIGLALEEQALQAADIKEIAETIRVKAAQLVDVKNFFLLSYDGKRDYYDFLFHRDEYDTIRDITQEDMKNSFSAYVIRQKKSKILRPKDIDELTAKGVLKRIGHNSKVWLGVPLIARHKVIGVMVVQNYTYEDAYDEHDLTILSTIAAQAAIAIDNYQLYKDLNKQLLQANALYDISQAIMQETPNIAGLLEKIVREAVEFSRAQAGQFITYDSAKNVFQVMFTYKLDELKGMEFLPDEGMIGMVIKSRKGYFTNDYFNETYVGDKLRAQPFKNKIQGMVQVPLIWNEEIIGILAMTSSFGNNRIFSQADVEQLEQFAGPVTIAIGIARTISFQQALLQRSPEAIIAIDNKGRINEFNQTSEQITGFNKRDMLEKFVGNFYYDGIEEARRMKKILDEGELTGKPVRNIHTAVKGKNSEKISILFSGSILKDEFGLNIGSIGMMRDLREITNIEKEYLKQQSILSELETMPLDSSIKQRDGLQVHIKELLRRAGESCHLEYMILFAGFSEKETVLHPFAWWGLPPGIESKLPIFNWRKARLLTGTNDADIRQETRIIAEWLPNDEWKKRIIGGIRGQNKEYFQKLACGVPVLLADNFRSLLIFGPFDDQNDLIRMEKFLRNIAMIINVRAMSWLQAIYLQARRKESEMTLQLITHRTRMYLQQITGKFGMVKQKVDKNTLAFNKADEGERLALHTARVISYALTSQSTEMEKEDFSFHHHSLAALVQNCAAAFEEKAREKKKEIKLDDSIDNLPQAEIDDRFLSVAIGNLIENALKYSFEDTFIKISSSFDIKTATIVIDDIGENMDDRARENLLTPGKRWVMSSRARQIPGSGFGLWDSSVIAVAHDGHIDFFSIPYKNMSGKQAHQVKVWLTIPLKQEKKNEEKKGDKI